MSPTDAVFRIDLGQHLRDDGHVVHAWIEPNHPSNRFQWVRDLGVLCVEGSATAGTVSLRLEDSPEEWWMLADAVGMDLAEALWHERAKYDERSFFMVYDHVEYGRLYFQPTERAAGAEGAVVLGTRRDGRYPNEQIAIPADYAVRQLEALFAHAHPKLRSPMIPDSAEIEVALEHGRQMAAAVMSAKARYEAIVKWDFETPLVLPQHEQPESPGLAHSDRTPEASPDSEDTEPTTDDDGPAP
ncbi:MAG: hypothetical protein JWL65_2705 [Gammaproteobacteria bacterium]|nr:hypothetical protein [Gammaproteobacteria bacterium]